MELLILIWLVCGVINYACSLAYFQCEFPSIAYEERHRDVAFAIGAALFGPVGTCVVICSGMFTHGFMLWPRGRR